jgi:hypothetical protein
MTNSMQLFETDSVQSASTPQPVYCFRITDRNYGNYGDGVDGARTITVIK